MLLEVTVVAICDSSPRTHTHMGPGVQDEGSREPAAWETALPSLPEDWAPGTPQAVCGAGTGSWQHRLVHTGWRELCRLPRCGLVGQDSRL